MTYKEWNKIIRDIAEVHKKIVPRFKLSGNVMLSFRRNEDKLLTIESFSKIVNGSGLSFEIVIKDANGKEIDGDTFKRIVIEEIKESNKNALAIIAGVTLNKNSDKVKKNKVKSKEKNKNKNDKSKKTENSEQYLAVSPEAKIDLSDIFADEG